MVGASGIANTDLYALSRIGPGNAIEPEAIYSPITEVLKSGKALRLYRGKRRGLYDRRYNSDLSFRVVGVRLGVRQSGGEEK